MVDSERLFVVDECCNQPSDETLYPESLQVRSCCRGLDTIRTIAATMNHHAVHLKFVAAFLLIVTFHLAFSPAAHGRTHGCSARDCFEGRIVKMRGGKTISYGLATVEGPVIPLDPCGNFSFIQLRQLLKERNVVVVGRKVRGNSGEHISADYIQAGFEMTSRFGLLRIRFEPLADRQEGCIYRGRECVMKTKDELVLHAMYRLQGQEVVLFSEIGGSGGYGPFQLLTLRPGKSPKISEPFGNGLEPEVEVTKTGLVLRFKYRSYGDKGETVTYNNGSIVRHFEPYPTNPALTADLRYSMDPALHIVLTPLVPHESEEALFVVSEPKSTIPIGESEHRFARPILGLKPIEVTFPRDGVVSLGNTGTYVWKCVVGGKTIAGGTFARNVYGESCKMDEIYRMPAEMWTTKEWKAISSIGLRFGIWDRGETILGKEAFFTISDQDQHQYHGSVVLQDQPSNDTIAVGLGTEFLLNDNATYVWSWSIMGTKVSENTLEIKAKDAVQNRTREIVEKGYRRSNEVVCP